MTEWQPESTAPVNEHVLTFDKLGTIDVAMKFTDGDWSLTADYTGLAGSDWKPTHWMPLPEGPK
jgi:hypothetical protein